MIRLLQGMIPTKFFQDTKSTLPVRHIHGFRC